MTTSPPAKDLVRYDLLVQEALKGVVRRVLTDAARDGLQGEHHFYISFRTEFPGGRLSQRMRDKYPEEMTIVLQHQFWDLGVTEHSFEVGLSFSGVPERLLVPFDSIVGFLDPSVQFGLKFESQLEQAGQALPIGDAGRDAPAPPRSGLRAVQPQQDPAARPLRGAASEPAETAPAKSAPAEPAPKGRKTGKAAAEPAPTETAREPEEGSARIVSLDAFRKKP